MKKLVLSIAGALALAGTQTPALAADHYGKIAEDVHVSASGLCVLFRLNGVEHAAPDTPDMPWFALSRDHPAFAELFAILLTGAAGKRSINVHTSGRVCGPPAIVTIALN